MRGTDLESRHGIGLEKVCFAQWLGSAALPALAGLGEQGKSEQGLDQPCSSLCHTHPHLRHGDMPRTDGELWVSCSFIFPPPLFFFSTHLEKCFVWPLGCENSLSKKRTNCAMKLGFGMMACNLSLKGFLCPWLIHILQTFVTELQGPGPYSSSDSCGLQTPQCL